MDRLQQASLQPPSASLQPSLLLHASQVRRSIFILACVIATMQARWTSGNQVGKSALRDEEENEDVRLCYGVGCPVGQQEHYRTVVLTVIAGACA